MSHASWPLLAWSGLVGSSRSQRRPQVGSNSAQQGKLNWRPSGRSWRMKQLHGTGGAGKKTMPWSAWGGPLSCQDPNPMHRKTLSLRLPPSATRPSSLTLDPRFCVTQLLGFYLYREEIYPLVKTANQLLIIMLRRLNCFAVYRRSHQNANLSAARAGRSDERWLRRPAPNPRAGTSVAPSAIRRTLPGGTALRNLDLKGLDTDFSL